MNVRKPDFADPELTRWIVMSLGISAAHVVDHLLRGDYNPALNSEAYMSIGITMAIFASAGIGLYAYLKGYVAERFWFGLGSLGLALTLLAHVNPYAEQNVAFIFRAYPSPVGGAIAVSVLLLLVAVLLTATIKAAQRSRKA